MQFGRKPQMTNTNTCNTEPTMFSYREKICFSVNPTEVPVHVLWNVEGSLTNQFVMARQRTKPVMSPRTKVGNQENQFNRKTYTVYLPKEEPYQEIIQQYVYSKVARAIAETRPTVLSKITIA